jgi:hypothetical protein
MVDPYGLFLAVRPIAAATETFLARDPIVTGAVRKAR